MGEAQFESDRPFTESDIVGVLICRTYQGNIHAGMRYVDEDDNVQVLHLGWEDYLASTWSWHALWVTPPFDEARLDSVAGLCQLILERYQENRTFPYALQFLGSHFSQDGRLVVGEGARGLTCSTFILAVFGMDLVVLVMVSARAVQNFRV